MNPWFVVNPRAGGVRYGELTKAIRRQLAGREATISGDPPDAEGRSRLVVAVGGDGTVNRVINRCDPRRLRLGILPRGSANDLGRALAIPADLGRAWELLEAGASEEIDLISVNGSRFATCGGFGLAAEVALRANRWKAGWTSAAARRLGPLVYVLASLAELSKAQAGIAATVRAGGVTRRLHLAGALVSNQRHFGRWFSASPQASNRDGQLDFCGVEATGGRARLLSVFGQMLRGGCAGRSGVVALRARSLAIETDADVTFFGDGEPLSHGRRFRIEVLRRALTVVTGRSGAALAEAA